MNFTISKSEFLNALVNVSHAITSNSPQVTLRGIKIDLRNNEMTLTGSNADISIEMKLVPNELNQLNIIEEGSLLLDTRILLDIIKNIDSNTVSIEIIDGAFTKFSGNSAVFKINGMNPDDYPMIDFSRPEDSIQISSAQLKEMIDQTTFAASQKETRPVLTGVNFKLENNELTLTATDSYRLSRKKLPFNVDHSFNITIPSKTLNEVKNTMLNDEDEMIELCISAKKAQFISNGMVLQTRLLDGGFPDTDRLIPTAFESSLTINRDDLIHAIYRTIFIKNDNMAVVRLQCSTDEIVLTNKSQEIGESREVLSAKYEGNPIDISFSGNYVMEAARALKNNEITLNFTGAMKPFIMTDSQDETILELVLPVRTYN